MSYQNDGVLDVFTGWCLFLAGLLMFTEIFWMAGAYVALIAPMIWSFKETVTVPRLHRDELDAISSQRSARLNTLVVVGLIAFALLGLALLAILAGLGDGPLYIAGGIVATIVLSGFLLLGHLCRAPRWYAYAALSVILGALARPAGVDFPWVIMAVGASMALSGTFLLVRFLRTHPLLPLNQRPEF